MAINAVFTSTDWGKTQGFAHSEEGLFPGGVVYVSEREGPPIQEVILRNGKEVWNPRGFNSNLRHHIVGPYEACVQQISLRARRDGELNAFPYILEVEAQGPRGLGNGSLRLEFSVPSNVEYIDIWSSIPRSHVLGLNEPGIKMIKWFHVD